MEQFKKYEEQLAKVKLVHWEELPDIELYVDQVVRVVNEPLNGLGLPPVTRSMVNNYVKHGMVIAPVKKRYGRHQIATIMVISLLKNLFPLSSIQEGINQLTLNSYPKVVYDYFVDLVNAKFAGQPLPRSDRFTQNDGRLMRIVVDALGNWLAAVAVLSIMKKDDKPRELGTSSKRGRA